MKVFSQLLKTSIIEYSIYRVNFLLWRFRTILNFLIVFFLWKSVYSNNNLLLGYTPSKIQTYIFVSAFITSIVMSTRVENLAGEIINGDIIGYIIRPYSILKIYIVKDIVDKLLNTFLSLIEIITLYILLKPNIVLSCDIFTMIVFLYFVLIGIIISFCINSLLSFIGFWSNEVWAPKFIFHIIITFVSGSYFPLNMLPTILYNFLLLTPFPYLFFIPSLVLLNGANTMFLNTPQVFFIPLIWVLFLTYLCKSIWSIGMKNYSFYGR